MRACCDCGKPLSACFGFVIAGDFVLALSGALPREEVRERCGVCVERIIFLIDAIKFLLGIRLA